MKEAESNIEHQFTTTGSGLSDDAKEAFDVVSSIETQTADGTLHQADTTDANGVDLGSVDEGSSITFTSVDLLANSMAVHGDQDELSVSNVSVDASKGSITTNEDGTFTFTPTNVDATLNDLEINYTVNDWTGSKDVTATIDVNNLNNEPDDETLNLQNVGVADTHVGGEGYVDHADSNVTTGDGNDTINIADDVENSANINTGAGNDTINVGDDFNDGVINTGAGNDTVTVGDHMHNDSQINTGAGDDTVNIHKAEDSSSIDTGAGDDSVNIDRIQEDVTLDTGAGNDRVTLDNVSHTFDNGSINLGSGDDSLTINDNLHGSDATFDGGDGVDALNLTNVTKEEWDNGVKDNFENFESVALKDGTVDLTDTTASAPILEINIDDAIARTTSTTTSFNDNTNHNMSDGSHGFWFHFSNNDTISYDLGGTTTSANINFNAFDSGSSNWFWRSDKADEATIKLVDSDGNVVDTQTVTADNLDSSGNFVIHSDSAFSSIQIEATQSSFVIDSVNADNVVTGTEITYEYPITLHTGLTDIDGSESLSDITLENLPDATTLHDSAGNEIVQNSDGSYSLPIDANGNANVTLLSNREISHTDLNNITSEVTATESNADATMTTEAHALLTTKIILIC